MSLHPIQINNSNPAVARNPLQAPASFPSSPSMGISGSGNGISSAQAVEPSRENRCFIKRWYDATINFLSWIMSFCACGIMRAPEPANPPQAPVVPQPQPARAAQQPRSPGVVVPVQEVRPAQRAQLPVNAANRSLPAPLSLGRSSVNALNIAVPEEDEIPVQEPPSPVRASIGRSIRSMVMLRSLRNESLAIDLSDDEAVVPEAPLPHPQEAAQDPDIPDAPALNHEDAVPDPVAPPEAPAPIQVGEAAPVQQPAQFSLVEAKNAVKYALDLAVVSDYYRNIPAAGRDQHIAAARLVLQRSADAIREAGADNERFQNEAVILGRYLERSTERAVMPVIPASRSDEDLIRAIEERTKTTRRLLERAVPNLNPHRDLFDAATMHYRYNKELMAQALPIPRLRRQVTTFNNNWQSALKDQIREWCANFPDINRDEYLARLDRR